MLQKLSAVILSLTLLATQASFAIAEEDSFTDLKPDDKNYQAVEYLKENDVLSGYPDGSFRPNSATNRAELLKLLITGQDVEPQAETFKNCFPDVVSGAWYEKYVCYAYFNGWVQGYPDGTFKPEQKPNKAESLKMLLKAQGVSTESASEGEEWYRPFLKTALEKKIIEEADYGESIENIQAGETMSRGEVAESLFRIIATKQTNNYTFSQAIGNQVLGDQFNISNSGNENTNSNNSSTTSITNVYNEISNNIEQNNLSDGEGSGQNGSISTEINVSTGNEETTAEVSVEANQEPVEEPTEEVAEAISQPGVLTISDEDGGIGSSSVGITSSFDVSSGEQHYHLGTFYFQADYGDVTITEIPLTLNMEADWINAGFYLEVDDQPLKKIVLNGGHAEKITTDGVPSGKIWDSAAQTYVGSGDTAFINEAGLLTIKAGENKKVSLYFDNNVEYVECGLDFLPTLKPSNIQSDASGLGNSESFWFNVGKFTVKFPQDEGSEKCATGDYYHYY